MNRKRGGFTAALVLVTSVWMTGPAQAQTNCNTPNSSFEDVYCLTKTFVQADADLNVAYQKLMKKLKPADQSTLRQLQRAWVEDRNARTTSQDSKARTVIDIDLAVEMTTSRSNFLNDRYRECVSSGCQPNKLK